MANDSGRALFVAPDTDDAVFDFGVPPATDGVDGWCDTRVGMSSAPAELAVGELAVTELAVIEPGRVVLPEPADATIQATSASVTNPAAILTT